MPKDQYPEISTPSAEPIDWIIVDKRTTNGKQGKPRYVRTKYWIDAKELGSMKFGIPYDFVQAIPRKPL
jgi:hypothetical protein